jgi:hypothetical protein
MNIAEIAMLSLNSLRFSSYQIFGLNWTGDDFPLNFAKKVSKNLKIDVHFTPFFTSFFSELGPKWKVPAGDCSTSTTSTENDLFLKKFHVFRVDMLMNKWQRINPNAR